ncbi:MAG TPA: DegT/DnrJ/EryC1/StrS family aminotransferase [Gemmatimonadales bacterium]|nr:DegT/DnrJ/EryC1/StrS family aminotransferase [Gemmatimonadales bacterium]
MHSPLPALAAGQALRLRPGSAAAGAAVDAWLASVWAPRRILRTDSGTSALRLAIEAATAVTAEPRVAAPAYVCYDVATALDGAGATPVLYDLDPSSLGPDPVSLRSALEAGARTIIAVHLYGVPVDLAAIRRLASEYGALVIEDAAQAIGGRIAGQPAGSLGDLGVLSFGRGKGVTGGGGGALLVFESRVDTAIPSELPPSRNTLRDRAALMAQGAFSHPDRYWLPMALPGTGLGETVYHESWSPRGQSSLSTAVLSRTMLLADAETRTRIGHAAQLRDRVANQPRFTPITPPDRVAASWLRFPVVFRGEGTPPYPAARRLGVMPGYPNSLADLPGFRERVVNRSDPFPGARTLAARLGTLPTHGLLSPADFAGITRWLEGLR